MEESGRGLILRYYPSIYLVGLTKAMKTLIQDSRSLGRDLNPVNPECVAGLLTTGPRSSAFRSARDETVISIMRSMKSPSGALKCVVPTGHTGRLLTVRIVWCAESNGTTEILIKIGVGQGFSTRGPLAGFQRLSQMK
jgi:hypothetical protein